MNALTNVYDGDDLIEVHEWEQSGSERGWSDTWYTYDGRGREIGYRRESQYLGFAEMDRFRSQTTWSGGKIATWEADDGDDGRIDRTWTYDWSGRAAVVQREESYGRSITHVEENRQGLQVYQDEAVNGALAYVMRWEYDCR